MSRFKVFVRDEAGKARLVVQDLVSRTPVGMMVTSWIDYEALLRRVLGAIARETTTMLGEHLGKLLWEQAQRASGDDTEEAKSRLLRVGVNNEWLEKVSVELGRRLGERLVSHVPEHKSGTGTEPT